METEMALTKRENLKSHRLLKSNRETIQACAFVMFCCEDEN